MKPGVFFFTILSFLTTLSFAQEKNFNSSKHRYFMQMADGKEIVNPERILPKNCSSLYQFQDLLVFHCKNSLNASSIQKIKNKKKIISLHKDSVLKQTNFFLGSKLSEKKKRMRDCYNYIAELEPSESVADLAAQLEGVMRFTKVSNSCFDTKTCWGDLDNGLYVDQKSSKLSKLQLAAQDQLDFDLVKEDLKNENFRPIKVAVIDSGYNHRKMAKHFQSKVISTTAIDQKLVGNLNTAHNDHGTKIISLYNGMYGVGMAPQSQVSSYKVSMGSNGNAYLADMIVSVKKACEDGNRIINLSYHDGDTPIEEAYPTLSSELASKGCVLLKAAGNYGFPGHAKAQVYFDNILRVNALSSGTGLPLPKFPFGEIGAPGSNVLVIGEKPYRSCDNQEKKLTMVPGSSFAASLVGTLLTNIISILENSPPDGEYHKMTKEDQTNMAMDILFKSNHKGQANYNRAIKLAFHYRDNQNFNKQTDHTAYASKFFKKSCTDKPKTCELAGCSQIKSCTQDIKRYLSSCEDPELVQYLVNEYIVNGEYQRAAQALKYLPFQKDFSIITPQKQLRDYFAKHGIDMLAKIKLRTQLSEFEKNGQKSESINKVRARLRSLKSLQVFNLSGF